MPFLRTAPDRALQTSPSACSVPTLVTGVPNSRVFVYVDGFNLYYRALKGKSGVKWLDIRALATRLLKPTDTVVSVRYFTARVSGAQDPDAPRRQNMYLSALQSFPEYQLHFGNFLAKTITRPLVNRPATGNPFVEVHHFEEKGSDVNLACHLLNDAWKNSFDAAVVVTNDTDLVEPIKLVRADLGKVVGVWCPAANCAKGLRNVASFVRHLSASDIRAAQFSDPIPGTTIAKPADW